MHFVVVVILPKPASDEPIANYTTRIELGYANLHAMVAHVFMRVLWLKHDRTPLSCGVFFSHYSCECLPQKHQKLQFQPTVSAAVSISLTSFKILNLTLTSEIECAMTVQGYPRSLNFAMIKSNSIW